MAKYLPRIRLGEEITVSYDGNGLPVYGGIEVIVTLAPGEKLPRNIVQYERYLKDQLKGKDKLLKIIEDEKKKESDLVKALVKALKKIEKEAEAAEWCAAHSVVVQSPGTDPEGNEVKDKKAKEG